MSAFRMSQYPITRAQFDEIMGTDPVRRRQKGDPSASSGTNDPVQRVSWYHAIAFCNELSLLEGLTPVYSVQGVYFAKLKYTDIPTEMSAPWDLATCDWSADGYRLPTDMEWMWAAMGADIGEPGKVNVAGYQKQYAGQGVRRSIDDYAWYDKNSDGKTRPVGTKKPNELGLYDMSGNVWEWLWDWHERSQPPRGALKDYRGPESNRPGFRPGSERVARGGSWNDTTDGLRISVYSRNYPHFADYDRGFRVVRRP